MNKIFVTAPTLTQFQSIRKGFDLPDFEDVAYEYSFEAGATFLATDMETGHDIAIGGVVPIHEGTGEFWIAPALNDKWSTRQLLTATQTVVNIIRETKKFHRLQLNVIDEKAKDYAFVRKLGFEPEGILRKYGLDGGDRIILALVD